jgi:hypothetical protein
VLNLLLCPRTSKAFERTPRGIPTARWGTEKKRELKSRIRTCESALSLSIKKSANIGIEDG